MTARLSTHVIDTVAGTPAPCVDAVLIDAATGRLLGSASTDADGRIARLNDEVLDTGDVRLVLDLEGYWQRTWHGDAVLYPTITVHARLECGREHYHLPVLASPCSYTTYLGS